MAPTRTGVARRRTSVITTTLIIPGNYDQWQNDSAEKGEAFFNEVNCPLAEWFKPYRDGGSQGGQQHRSHHRRPEKGERAKLASVQMGG